MAKQPPPGDKNADQPDPAKPARDKPADTEAAASPRPAAKPKPPADKGADTEAVTFKPAMKPPAKEKAVKPAAADTEGLTVDKAAKPEKAAKPSKPAAPEEGVTADKPAAKSEKAAKPDKPAAEDEGVTAEKPDKAEKSDKPAADKQGVTTKPRKGKPAADTQAVTIAPKPKKKAVVSQGVWGIDLGQCALKALRLQEIDGKLTATAFDYVEYPKILSQPDADPDQLTREALTQFLTRNNLRGDQVAISVPGQSGLARFVKLPPVEEKKIADIVKFEAKQQIPFNLDEVVWDYQKLGSGEVIDGFALETEIGLFAIKRDVVARFLSHFKEVGVEVNLIQMAPLSLCNFVAYDLLTKDAKPEGGEAPPKGGCVVALDLGTDSSNLVVTDGGKIIWQRPIPIGGNHFTRALTKEMKLTFAKAEHLKRNATKSGAAELKKILGTLKPVLNDFVLEVQRSLGYFTNTHRDAQVEYLLGLGNAFRLPGLQRFLAEKLQLDVRKLDRMARLEGDAVTSAPIYNENILSFGVAYGLALQGLKRAKLTTNLLPGEIRMERLVKAKKPWAAVSAAVLLFGLGAAALGNWISEKPYHAPGVETAIKKSETVKTAVTTNETNFKKAKDDALAEEGAVSAIVAGQSERLNWMHLTRFVSDAIPKPDGTNLSKEPNPATKKSPYQVYFLEKPSSVGKVGVRVESGKEAFEDHQKFIRDSFKGAPEDRDDLPPFIDNLVQFQIESLDARYCDDLGEFWKNVMADKSYHSLGVLPRVHRETKPQAKEGWVIELAGFTYHRDQDAFIRETLLNNLARLGAPEATAAADKKDDKKDDKKEEKKDDKDSTREPVVNRISHVVLLKYLAKSVADGTAFEVISTGVLDPLIGGSSGGDGNPRVGGAGGGQVGAGAVAPPAGGGQAGMGGGGGAMGGVGGGEAPKATRASWRPLSSRSSGTGTSNPTTNTSQKKEDGKTPTPKPKAGHQRTEFIILFIWQEPTPSDALRGVAADTSAKK